MVRNFLQWVGLLALVLWTVAGFAAMALVKDKVHITIEADSTGEPGTPDPVSLLRDDFQVMRSDLSALAESLSRGLVEIAAAQETDSASLRDAIRGAAENSIEQPPQSDQGPHEDGPRRSFLAFTLPSESFRFDIEQEFTVLPRLSRVGFDAKSTLHDFSGVTSALEGSLVTNLSDPSAHCAGAIAAEAGTLDTGLEDRNSNMYEYLLTAEHERIRFEIASFRTERVDTDSQEVTGEVRGTMSIRGEDRDFSMPVRVSVDAAKRVVVTGEAGLSLTEYGIPVPSTLGVISMEDDVRVWIALRMRSIASTTPTGEAIDVRR